MKRGSSLRRHVRLARVSAKVKRARPEFARVYELVDARSGGQCEVVVRAEWLLHVKPARTASVSTFGAEARRCIASATEHHHLRKPRRSTANHVPALVIHLCHRHHAMTTASYQVGRLLITPAGDGTFTRQVVQKAGKWA